MQSLRQIWASSQGLLEQRSIKEAEWNTKGKTKGNCQVCCCSQRRGKGGRGKVKGGKGKLREVEEGKEPEEPEESEEPEVEQEEVEPKGQKAMVVKKATAVKTGSDAGGPKGATGTSSTERPVTHHLSSTLQEFIGSRDRRS